MYWLSAKQLLDWIKNLKSDDDPQILVKKFSLKMQESRKLEKGSKIAILLLTFSRAVVKVLFENLLLVNQNYDNYAAIPWTLSVLNWITATFCLAILSMFVWSLKTIK